MAKLFDANGNEVEAFTPEELEAKKQEAIDAYLKEHPDQSAALTQAQKDLETAQNKLKEIEGKDDEDPQKKRLIKERDDANAALEEVKTTLTKEITDLKTNIFGSAKEKILSKLAGGDAELRKKIETEYDGFAGEAVNEQQIQERLTKAYTLAKGVPPAPNFMDSMGSAAPRGVDQNHGVQTQETDNSKAMRKAFGITDQDAAKHAPKPEGQN